MDGLQQQRRRMINDQLISRGIEDSRVLEAMDKVPREKFAGLKNKAQAYDDRPLPIGSGQTISQPYIVALMTQLLQLNGKEKVLEIGTGSGYQTAILAELAQKVYSVEAIKEFHTRAQKLLITYRNVYLYHGNGYNGWKEHAPYDRIIVTAAPERIPPPLTEQLAPGGIMIIPVGTSPFNQTLYKITRKGQNIEKEAVSQVAFVPLREEL
ncbi:MAG: protein-L-isoaspartate(D-aspartate) O-methyltransferase [Actinomycetia bacterium]|nr:protein-L-isoaspartate(D-aspartate) O-methyltransferase [Actinomycetes bacterium]